VRRYAPLKQSRGTTWPVEVREAARERDGGCIGPLVGMPGACFGGIELDHIRASGAIGMKSRSTLDNAASLCAAHHPLKTREGRKWRPLLIEYVDFMASRVDHDAHVDRCPECPVRVLA
jgi:hypothetical protein